MLTSNDTSTTNYVVVLSVATPSSVWPSNVFQTAAGANITIVCTGSTGNVWNGTGNTATESVTGWNPSTGQIAFNVPNTATTPTFWSAGTVTETGVYAPTQTAYVIEAENKTGAAPASNSGVELLGGFGGGFIMNIGQRGANLNPAPRIQGLQFNDMSQTGAGAGGLLCTQCLNGEFTDLSFVSFNGKTSYTGAGGTVNILSAGLKLSSSATGGDYVVSSFGSGGTVTLAPILQPNTEINSIYDIRCTNNSVCIDAGSTIGSDQDGPHVYGGYIQLSNTVNTNSSSSTTPYTQSCTGIWAAGPLRYYGGLTEVGSVANNNCLGIWSTGGASEIIGKFEQHANPNPTCTPGSDCYGTGVYINPGSGVALTGGSAITGMQRDTNGLYVTVRDC